MKENSTAHNNDLLSNVDHIFSKQWLSSLWDDWLVLKTKKVKYSVTRTNVTFDNFDESLICDFNISCMLDSS